MAKKTKKRRWTKDWPKASRPKVVLTGGMNPIPSPPPPAMKADVEDTDADEDEDEEM